MNDGAGDVGEVGVVDAGYQKSERECLVHAQALGQQARRVVAASRLLAYGLDSLLADTIFLRLSAEYA